MCHSRVVTIGQRLLRDNRGVTAIEFALVATPVLAMIVAVIQLGIVFLAQAELETAVEKSARTLLTGQAQQASTTQTQFLSTVCSNLPALFTCSQVMVDLQTASSFSAANTSAPTLTYDSNGNVTNTWQFQMGAAGTIMVLRVIYQFPVSSGPLGFTLANLSNGKRLMMATAVFEAEPYGSN